MNLKPRSASFSAFQPFHSQDLSVILLTGTQSRTFFHVASKSASLEIVDLLVKYKADINAIDIDGFTPLHLAAIYGNIQVLKKLLVLNADVNLKVDGKDAADLAQMKKGNRH